MSIEKRSIIIENNKDMADNIDNGERDKIIEQLKTAHSFVCVYVDEQMNMEVRAIIHGLRDNMILAVGCKELCTELLNSAKKHIADMGKGLNSDE